jgi:hypothetical protein
VIPGDHACVPAALLGRVQDIGEYGRRADERRVLATDREAQVGQRARRVDLDLRLAA